MKLFGKNTIHPFLFITGKLAGYFTWIVLILMLLNINIIEKHDFLYNELITYTTAGIGFVFVVLSLITLGFSTRIGLPEKKTILKTKGVYIFTRNPMYVGIHLWTLSAMLHSLNVFIIFAGIYSIITYHCIVLGEEKFLQNRFGQEYTVYKKKVRRYL